MPDNEVSFGQFQGMRIPEINRFRAFVVKAPQGWCDLRFSSAPNSTSRPMVVVCDDVVDGHLARERILNIRNVPEEHRFDFRWFRESG